MPGKIKVKILAGRNLPVMDRSGDTTDAYVELKFGNTTYKTDVCRKSLNPQWNSEWYKFEVDDADLQDEPLQIRLMDHDTYSANDAIGKVYINLNPLLLPGVPPTVKNMWTLEAAMNTNTGSQTGSVMTGWIPVYDTMHGIRGEVNIIVKVELFSDFNKFRQSSCGVQFFYSPNIPYGYHTQSIHGFVEELVVSDDPEYKWIDKIRTPRASNEARQTLFFKLSGEVQRKIGLKALDLGGNAVIGYLQNFDLEGESGIVARGIGTAVTLVKTQDIFNFPPDSVNVDEVALAYYSQSKSQTERTGITPNRISCPLLTEKRNSRFNDNFSRYKPSPRSPIRAGRKFEYRRVDTVQEFYPQSMRLNKSCVGLGKATSSYSSLSQALIDDASMRMMLAQEDERGEYGRSRLDASLKNLKKLFGANESDSNWRMNALASKSSSARNSVVSIGNFWSERSAKAGKAPEGIAALLIKSLHSVPLEHVNEGPETLTCTPTSNYDNEVGESSKERAEAEDDETEHCRATEGRRSRSRTRMRRQKVTDRADDLDLSYEENTPTSESDASNEKTSYDVLRDSALSSDEEAEETIDDRFGKPLTRAGTFPQTKVRFVRRRLQRVDSVTRPLHEESTLSLARCLSENQVSDARFSSQLVIDVTKMSPFFKRIPKHDAAANGIEAASLEFSKDFAKVFEGQPGTENSQDFNCPIATSTPIEIRPPFFPAKPESEGAPNTLSNPDTSTLEELPEKEDSKSVELQESFDRQDGKEVEDHRQVAEEQGNERKDSDTNETRENAEFKKDSVVSSINENNKIDNNDHQQGAFIYPYTVLPSANNVGIKEDKEPDEESPPPSLEKSESFKRNELTLQIKGQDNTSTFTTSTHSLPSLSYYPLAETLDQKLSRDKEEIVRSMSTIRSSIESLLQFSSNEALATVRKGRQKCMLDLIRIIDTKMMSHPQHHNNGSNDHARRRRHERPHRHPRQPDVPKSHHHRQIRRHVRRSTTLEFTHVSSTPSSPSLSSSAFVPPKTDSSSRVSSLDSLSIRDVHSSRLRTTTRTSGSLSFLARQKSARDLTVDTQSSESPRNASVIELKELKSRETNPLTATPAAYVGTASRESNVREVSESNGGPTNSTNTANITDNSCVSRPCPVHRHQDEGSLSPSYPLPTVSPMVAKVCQSPANKPQLPVPLHRRSSDSDLSVTPKGNSLGGSDRSMGGLLKSTAVIRTMNQDALEMLEYPFITMQQYPPGFIIHIGGLVSSRSVKLLERISNLEEPEGRDAWWTEIRMEVRSHARALACNVVIGYREETSICDDVCVLNASGTAAVINLHSSNPETDPVFVNKLQGSITAAAEGERDKPQPKSTVTKPEKSESETIPTIPQQTGKMRHTSEGKDHEGFGTQFQTKCNLCHLPYSEASVPFRVSVSKCATCKRAKVPDVMFTTIELPENMPTTGRGCFIQATVCKNKKDLRAELNAKEISDCLPFLEYEMHSLLLNKLKVKGMNAIFGLKLQVSVGERLIVGMAVGTAVFLTALPAPSVPQIASLNSWHNEEQLAEIQKNLLETVKKNREFYRLKPVVDVENGRVNTSDTDESDEELPDLDFSVGTRDTCVLEVDDTEDMDRISLLMDERPPDDFHVVNTQSIPGLEDLEIVRNLQMFTQISRAKIPTGQSGSMPSKYFAKLLQSVYFKLRRMVPCAVCDMQFKLALPEPDEIQFTVVGMALGLGDPVKVNKFKKKLMSHSASKDQVKKPDDSEMIFSLDVEHTEAPVDNTCSNTFGNSNLSGISVLKARPRSPLRTKTHLTHRHKHVPLKGRYGVDITPLSYLPGGRIERYLGNLNFFFIRESTSIRENGGLSGFTHSFVMEVLAIVRAHITALGGNAMVAFFMTQCVLLHSPHKNQGQCLINVGGDVVSVSYFADEKHTGVANC